MNEFCGNCGAPTDHLAGDSETNTCGDCGHPVEPETDIHNDHDDPYAF